MKPLLLTIPILIALAVLQPLVIRHVDPSLVPESNPDAIALAKLYISYSSHLSSFNISLAKAILSNASMAYIPERLRIAYQRMNELLKSFTDSVNNTKILLDIAEALYMKGDYNASLAVLNNVNTSLRAVEARYYEIEIAINVLYSLGLPANVLKQILSNLNSTFNSLKTRHIELLNKLRKAINTSIGTLLTIDVSREEVFYGESLGVYGRLVSEHGYGIANKTINIYLGPGIYKAVTNGSGHFGTSIPVAIYQSPVRVYAEFLSDGVYRYSRSRDIYIRVIFFKPNISAWIDNSTYLPGRSISLHVHAGKGLEVVVRGPFGFNASFISNGSVYNFSIPIPPLAREGIYIINVFSLPRGIIGPGSVSLAVNVTRLMPSVRINAPSYLITGLTYTISVFPSVESYIEVYTSPGIATLARGYEISLSIPHTYLGRSVGVLLHVSPLDPGYRSVDLELELPVYNILIIFSLAFPHTTLRC